MPGIMLLSRELKRVPLDFNFPIDKTWTGYLLPDDLCEDRCDDCDGTGYSPEARRLKARWYGEIPFDPTETGSERLTPDTPAVHQFAERNVERSPDFYDFGELAIRREAERLADLWNGQWCHHLEQVDVDALVAAGRLIDFTHTWSKETGRRQPRDPVPTITAAEVNTWSLIGFGHDSLNCHIVIDSKCEREGYTDKCSICEGQGGFEKYPGQHQDAEAWKPTEPPEGNGYQLWQTVSEGGPCSPVFATTNELAEWLSANDTGILAGKSVAEWLDILDDKVGGIDVATGDLAYISKGST